MGHPVQASENNDRIAYAPHWISADANGSGASWNKIYPLRKKYHELVTEEKLYNL